MEYKFLQPKVLANRFVQYSREFLACITWGLGYRDKLRLIVGTTLFHIHNTLDWPLKSNRPFTCSIRYSEAIMRLTLRTYSGDLFILFEIFLQECYSLPTQLAPGKISTVVDLGANIGLATLYFSTLFPQARFICVEPNRENFELLMTNVSNLGDRVVVKQAAASHLSGNTIFEEGKFSWQGKIGDQGISVLSLPMKELMMQEGIDSVDFLKVDIEGAEKDLFAENNDWLYRIKAMVVELHSPYSISDFTDVLTPFGHRILLPGSQGNLMPFALKLDPPIKGSIRG